MPKKLTKEDILKGIKEGKVTNKDTFASFVMIEELNQRLDEEIPQIKDVISRVKGDKGDKGEKGEKGERGEKGANGKDGRDGRDGKEGQKGSNGINGVDGKDGKDASPLDLLNEIPQLGEPIRDSLELLRDDARLDKDAIKGLDDYDEVARLARIKGTGGGGGSTARNFYQLMDVPVAYTEYAGSAIVVNSTATGLTYAAPGSGSGGSGTVTSVSVVTANGINGTVATPTTTPAITLDITALNATKIANGIISNTEFNYLDGLTSTIQTQLDSKLSANQAITLSGDVNGFGTTSITTTLSTVNSNVGTFGSNSVVPVFTVNGKGLITAVSSTTIVSGGTPGGANTQVQFNDSSSFGGDSSFTWNKIGRVLAIGSDAAIETNYIYNPAGSDLDILTAQGDAPGEIRITSGASTGSSAGGFITISAGAGSLSADGGSITLNGGSVPLTGLSDGGGFLLQGGVGRGSGYTGGNVEFVTGNFTDGATRGNFMFKNAGASSVYGILNFSELTTSNRTYGLQNTSGTLAILPIALASQVSGTLGVTNGGTGLATAPANGQLLIGNGTNYTLNNLTGGTNIAIANSAGNITVYSTASGGTPGGSTTQVQFNDAGSFGGDDAFTWNKTTNALYLTPNGSGSIVFNDTAPVSDIYITVDNQASTNIAGNAISITAGQGNGIALGGDFLGVAGSSTGGGGSAWLLAGYGNGVNTSGGNSYVWGGDANGGGNGAGGTTEIRGGAGVGTGDGGNVDLAPGVGSPRGMVRIVDPVTLATASINTLDLTAARTYGLQNVSGTLAVLPITLTSQVSGVLPVANGGTGTTFVSIPPSGVLVGRDDVQTLTNKRITYRVVTITDGTNFVINSDNADMIYMANTQAAGTLRINAATGTPTNGQELTLKVKSTNAQSIAWYLDSSLYVAGNGAYAIPLLSSTTGSSLIDYIKLKYDTVNSKWHPIGISTGL